MNVTEAVIPDTQDQESGSFTQTSTAPEQDTATNPVEEAPAASTTNSTTPPHAPEDVSQGVVSTTRGKPARGSLTFTSNQTNLTPEQRAAFQALGINPSDPIAAAHARRFIHVCQLWGVDPWSSEIHLVQRGKVYDGEDKRTWTIQTGIDGYRRRARQASTDPNCPVRWIGKADWFYSFGDDDPKGWQEKRHPLTGDVVMEPVWYSSWPFSEPPKLAKAVIEVEDKATGERRAETFIAHWDMFAVYEQVWEGKKKAFNPDGSPKQKLGAFWAKGPHHMLGKCAEAQVLRATFHGYFHGVYTEEEMGRADVEAAQQIEDAVAARRREAFRQAQMESAPVTVPVLTGSVEPATEPITEPDAEPVMEPVTGTDAPQRPATEPIPVGSLITQAVPLPESARRNLLLAEIDWMSDLLGVNVRNAVIRRAQRNLEDLNADDLLALVGPFRAASVIPHLRAAGRDTEADTYASFGPNFVGSVNVLLGHADPSTDIPDTASDKTSDQ